MSLMSLAKISPPWSLAHHCGPDGSLPSWVQTEGRYPSETIEVHRQGGTTLRAAVFEVNGRRFVQATGAREPFLSQGAFIAGLREVWPAMRWGSVKGLRLVAVAVLPAEVES